MFIYLHAIARELPKNGFATMEPLSRTWLISVSLPRSWLAFARSCMAMVSLPRSCHDLGKASKELVMDLGKGTMASNAGKYDAMGNEYMMLF